MRRKIAILPCTGVGQVVGTIARQAAYAVCDDLRPDRTCLVCLPALVKGVQEDIDMIHDGPVIVVEGCQERCATHALRLQGGTPAAEVFIPDIMKGTGLKIKREARRHLSEAEQRIADLVAERTASIVDGLYAEENP